MTQFSVTGFVIKYLWVNEVAFLFVGLDISYKQMTPVYCAAKLIRPKFNTDH